MQKMPQNVVILEVYTASRKNVYDNKPFDGPVQDVHDDEQVKKEYFYLKQ